MKLSALLIPTRLLIASACPSLRLVMMLMMPPEAPAPYRLLAPDTTSMRSMLEGATLFS
ncbi:hypothetical protein D3C72_2572960 [compost metagenome]